MNRVVMLALWVLCLCAAVIALSWMLLALIFGSKRAEVIAFGFDQTANAALGGSHDEKISSRAFRCGWWRVVAFIDGLFFFDPDHCRSSHINEMREAELYLAKMRGRLS